MLRPEEIARLVTGISVAVEVHAQPGDTLLVVNGVCIGVQTAQRARTLMVQGRKSPTEGKEWERGGKGVNSNNAIFEALRDGPLDTRHILDKLGLDVKDNMRRVVLQRIQRMKASGLIRKIKEDQHKNHARYEVSK